MTTCNLRFSFDGLHLDDFVRLKYLGLEWFLNPKQCSKAARGCSFGSATPLPRTPLPVFLLMLCMNHVTLDKYFTSLKSNQVFSKLKKVNFRNKSNQFIKLLFIPYAYHKLKTLTVSISHHDKVIN